MVLTAAFSRAPGAAEPRPGMLGGLLGVTAALGIFAIDDNDEEYVSHLCACPQAVGGGEGQAGGAAGCAPGAPRAVSQGRQPRTTSCGTRSHTELLPHD